MEDTDVFYSLYSWVVGGWGGLIMNVIDNSANHLPPPYSKTLSVGSLRRWLRGMNPIGFNCHGWADELYNNCTFSRESSFWSAVPLKPPRHPSGEQGSDGGEGRRAGAAESQKLLRGERRCSSQGQLPEKAAPVQTKSASQHASVACRGTSHSLPVGTVEHRPAVMQNTSASHSLYFVVHGACYTLGIPCFKKKIHM